MTPGRVSPGRVLIVAGSDSGGGAGIQADIKAVTALGGYAMTAITALTAQNTEGVFGVHAPPPEFVALQMRLTLQDIGADCVKIGMLHSVGVIEAVAGALAEYAAGVPVVLDPVMVAKGGHLEGETVRDVLIEPDRTTVFENPRIETRHTHGTGCTLASAIAAGVADGMALDAAVGRAIAWVQEAIRTAPGLGHGHGPLNHGHTVAPYFPGDSG